MHANTPSRLLTARETAELLRIHLVTLYSWVAEGRIPSVRLGRKRLFDPDAIRSWLAMHADPERDPLTALGHVAQRRRLGRGTP